jgi:quinol monooxygenase YgiN
MITEAEDRERLEKMTLKELKAVAKEEGICLGYDGSRKANAVGLMLVEDFKDDEGLQGGKQ